MNAKASGILRKEKVSKVDKTKGKKYDKYLTLKMKKLIATEKVIVQA